ncbi:MAG TPA: HIT domain-containing protein [Acidimicrobiales bacterium]|nr:HIT domain-containing protein [Acidimicrobiales bacterium]
MDGCRTCSLLERRDAGEAPDWDCIVRTESWDVVHCDNTSLLGWIVLVVRRHVAVLADLTEAEAAAMGPLIRRVSRALHEHVGCEKTYVVQFAEHPQHRHVHVHVVPRPPQLADDEVGPGIFKFLGVDDAARVSETQMNGLASALRDALTTSEPPPRGAAAGSMGS